MTSDEMYALYEIETGLALDDPLFVRRLARIRRRYAWRLISGVAMLAIGAVGFVGGLATHHIVLTVTGLALMLVATALVKGRSDPRCNWSGLRRRATRSVRRTGNEDQP